MSWISNLFGNRSQGPVAGRWSGHYAQEGRTFPIKATLKHNGSSISGRMLDLEVCRQQTLQSILAESGLSDMQIADFLDDVRSQSPESPEGEIEYRSFLPSESEIKGSIADSEISFTKRYMGLQETEYILNGLAMPFSERCELVQYNGNINSNLDFISGTWTIQIPEEDWIEASTFSGDFQLKRQSAV